MKTVEQQLKDLQETVKLLYSVVIEGKPYTPGSDEYFNVVIPALAEGDVKPLIAFNKRGGVIPDYEPLPKEAHRTYTYKPRKRTERPQGNPTNASGPVMLPGKERGASSVSSTTNL